MNCIHITGRLCADPELKQTQSGLSVCRFRVAVNRRFTNKQTGEREADFINCIAWRQTADFISRYFQKGGWIELSGELHNNDYTDNNGTKHYGMVVQCDNVGFVGNKDGSQSAQSAPYQAQQSTPSNYSQQQQASRQAAQNVPVQQMPQLGDLSEFEEILSDGDVPF
ncbi:single-stranded DNA-binding protein [uncultured Ruminococcus sp.]|uniref:single-stranded DNA-binding protein n=1 Tax=uncultured Ruminococcus sp. TaxID=165186 RepID=UPI0025DF8267|nr:single-stranded DNA-binding protein [uncultured Ruminococcus sp.]